MKGTAAPNLCGLGSTPRPGVSTSCVCWIYSRDKDHEVFRVTKTFPSSEKKNYCLRHHILINGTEGCTAQFYSTKRFSFIQERASQVEDAHCCYLGVKTS